MKSLIVAASALAIAAVAAPAFAQSATPFGAVTPYVDLGYSYADTTLNNFSANPGFSVIDGRLGAKLGRYLGAEGELGFGVNTTDQGGVAYKARNTYAGYAVAFLPVMPNADLFARVGYGHDNLRATVSGQTFDTGTDSVNFGAGGEYFVTPHDGIRLDYTRDDFRQDNGHADVWGVSYVHRF
jgi:hypothetical protein